MHEEVRQQGNRSDSEKHLLKKKKKSEDWFGHGSSESHHKKDMDNWKPG